MSITEIEVPEQQTEDIFLIDPDERQYEIFMTIWRVKQVKTSVMEAMMIIVLILMKTRMIQNDVLYV